MGPTKKNTLKLFQTNIFKPITAKTTRQFAAYMVQSLFISWLQITTHYSIYFALKA